MPTKGLSARSGRFAGATPSARHAWRVAALTGLGAAAYTAWVLEVVLSTGLNPIRTYVSELAAQDQPLGGLFRATDFTAGLLVFAGGLLALVRLARYAACGARGPSSAGPGSPCSARPPPPTPGCR